MNPLLFTFLFAAISTSLLSMALLQFLGGKFIAKLDNVTYGNAILISLISSVLTGIIISLLWFLPLWMMGYGDNSFVIIIQHIIRIIQYIISLLLPGYILANVTKRIWNCPDLLVSLRASSINIFANIILWLYISSNMLDSW